VSVRGGHVGYGRYFPVTFAVIATSKKQAVNKILGREGYEKKSRVKIGRDGSATVEAVNVISYEEYLRLKKSTLESAYCRAKNKQENLLLDPFFYEKVVQFKDKYAESHDENSGLRHRTERR
jgi:hypothetical protein